MIPLPIGITGLEVRRDPGDAAYEIEGWGDVYRLREWTWGERQRLVEACAATGQLDRAAFVDGLVDLLLTPPPPPALRPLYAHVALALLGVRPGQSPAPLDHAELDLALAFGWTPGHVRDEPAPAIDRLLENLEPRVVAAPAPAAAAGRAADPGWSHIVVDDD